MDKIMGLASDERTARMILAMASEPTDAVTGRMVRTAGATETVAQALSGDVPVGPDGDTWQRRLAPRIDEGQVRRILADTDRHGLSLLIPGDREWPTGVDALGDGAPLAFWAKGDTNLLTSPVQDRLTLTGARASTGYGEHVTMELAHSTVEDERQVVSGGAYGVDGAAHRAALVAGGSTIAVTAGGLDRLYPARHSELLTRVGEKGLLLSEMPPGAAPTKWRFLQRGRILAALSGAVVVVEAGYRSGALHTAARAVELHRPVGAVPGPITSAASAGCHRLLRDGLGTVITGYDDARALLDQRRGSTHRAAQRTAGLEDYPLDASRSSSRATGRGLAL